MSIESISSEPVPTELLIPRRSRYYHLDPLGIGTPYTESLTSYIQRLAEAHSLHTGTLVAKEIYPRLTSSFSFERSGSDFFKRSNTLNGTGKFSLKCIRALENLTFKDSLRFHTMQIWSQVLPWRGLLRPYKAWCPICFHEWLSAGEVIYEPLIWAIHPIKVCPKHFSFLNFKCPQCNRKFPFLSPRSRPGYCAKCGCWLGSRHDAIDSISDDELAYQAWIAINIGQLISLAPNLSKQPRKEDFIQALKTSVKQATNGNMAALGRLVDSHKNSARDWCTGRSLPTLDKTARLCYHFSIPLLDFLTGTISKKVTKDRNILVTKERTSTSRPFSYVYAKKALEEVIQLQESPPPSLQEVIKRTGYNRSTIYKNFPEHCRTISQRYIAYLKNRSKTRIELACQKVQEITLQLFSEGIYPSRSRVTTIMGKTAVLREKEINAAWSDTLAELNLISQIEQS